MIGFFYIAILVLCRMEASASDEKYIIKNTNRESVLKTCAIKSQKSNLHTSFVAIKSMMEDYTQISNAFDVIVILENGKFNSTHYDDYSGVQKVYAHGTKQVTDFKMGLATDRPDGVCLRVIVPDNLKLTKDAFYVSNDQNVQLNLNITPDIETKFKKLHFESCKKKYCVNKHFGDDCDYECVKPNKLFATSDLDNNKITEYWYDTLTSIGKVIFIVEPEIKGSSLLIRARRTEPVD